MGDRLGWTHTEHGWCQDDQNFAWDEADYKVKWDSALHLDVTNARPDFQGLEAGLATQTLTQVKLDGQSQKDNVKTALKLSGSMWPL
eukprot:1951447-Amphidinium_carterae.1